MTLQDLENAVLDHFNYSTDDGDSVVRRRIRRHLNEWQHRILTMPGLDRLRDSSVTVMSVLNTPTVSLGPAVGKILRVYETTHDTVLTIRDTEWYRRIAPDTTASTGLPTDVVLL